jgi:hypothetical protein
LDSLNSNINNHKYLQNSGLWVNLQAKNLRIPSIYRIFAAFKTPKNAAYEQEKVP